MVEYYMLDFPLMFWVKIPFVNRIHPDSNKFGTGVEIKAADDSKHTFNVMSVLAT